MFNKKPKISIHIYWHDMQLLMDKIDNDFDCVVALKRSGWILGVYLSNQKTLPLFTVSEIKSIPLNFNRILIVDDKTYSGKSLKRVINKLSLSVMYKTACIYVEGDFVPDYYVKNLGCISSMFYEK